VVLVAAFEARLARARPVGSWTSGQYAWAAMTEWTDGLGLDGAIDTSRQAAAVSARLLDRFGPMTFEDLQWWTGWTKGQTSKALEDGAAIEVALDDGSTGWVGADDVDRPKRAAQPWVAVLPGLDPTTMGWKQRGWYLDDDIAARVFDRWGNAGPTIWADGRIIGGWAQRRDGELATLLLRDITAEHRAQLDEQLARLAAAIGDTRFNVRFPSPIHRDVVR
jgi:hypothetical protein